MTNEHSLISAEPFDGDLYTSSQTRERNLNSTLDEPGRCLITGRTV
jgi:hypothetical protein